MASAGVHRRPRWPASESTAAYAALVGLMVGVRILFSVAAPDAPLASQAVLLSWPAIVVLSAVGAVGLVAASRTVVLSPKEAPGSGPDDSPQFPTIVRHRRYIEPVLVGLGFAVAFVALDLVRPLGIPRVQPPLSVPFYLFGAVASEILLRLGPLSLLVWLATRVRTDRRWQARLFVAGALITALIEPVGLLGTLTLRSGAVLGAVLGGTYLLNLAAAYLFWRFGFLAAVIERAAFYLGWHVLYGGLA